MDGGGQTDADFGAALYGLLAPGQDNLVFSPASIAAALRMTLCGARGDTAAELAAALRLSSPGDAAEGLRRLSAALADVAGREGRPAADVVFRAPNTMWVQSGLPLVPAFTATLREAAAVSVRDADFLRAAEQARREINDLVAKQTEDKITGLLARGTLNADTRLVLVNAIYLNAAWAFPFPEKGTEDGPFYPEVPAPGSGTSTETSTSTSTSAPLTVRMMRLRHELRYLRGDGYQAVVLPYRAAGLAMTIVLPDGPLGSLPAGLAAGLGAIFRRASRHRVTLTMPSFRQEAEFGLIPVLQRLGVEKAFGSGADFTGITTAEQLYIGAVVHKAYIDVAEWGTEAAAATAVAVRALAAARPVEPVTMTVDRPFLFAITAADGDLPLFLGQVTRPGQA
jgi:serpin B